MINLKIVLLYFIISWISYNSLHISLIYILTLYQKPLMVQSLLDSHPFVDVHSHQSVYQVLTLRRELLVLRDFLVVVGHFNCVLDLCLVLKVKSVDATANNVVENSSSTPQIYLFVVV